MSGDTVLPAALGRLVTASIELVDYEALFEQLPTSYMVMDLDLRYVAVNDAYLATTGRTREELIGQYVFDAFPPSADALDVDGVAFVQRSFERARDTGAADTMPLQKYDIPDPTTGGMSERWWSLISVPIRGRDGQVAYVAQRAEDVTDWVRQSEDRQRTEQLSRRVLEVEADLYARAQELRLALAAKEQAAARAASLAAVAMELTAAETAEDLSRIIFSRGLPVLGADSGAISVVDPEAGVLRLFVSPGLGDPIRPSELPLESPLPAAHVARTGEALYFPTVASGLEWSADLKPWYDGTGRKGWATLPLRLSGEVIGSLVAAWDDERAFSGEDVGLMEGFAAQIAQAVRRLQATAAERAAARAATRLSEALQRSLLTAPPESAELAIAVRYQPAAQEAQVGGDWYDAFLTAQGSTVVVIGDVSGHDRTAAAAMGQVRNLLRGIAVDSDDGPAVLLTRLDRAMQHLGLDALATALLARVDGLPGRRHLTWSNAGHPPAVLRAPDGATSVLEAEPDLLLGLEPGTQRSERTTALEPGSMLVLFTDGLVERRRSSLDLGIERVVDAVRDLTEPSAEALADAVLAAADPGNEDDIAVLVLHVVP